MSSIKVTNINNASAASGGIAFDADGHVTVDGLQLPSAGALSNRNKIINGAMTIDQRNAGASVTAGSSYTLDRWNVDRVWSGSTVTIQQSTTAPTDFTNSLVATVSTGAAVAAASYFSIQQYVEGYNFANLNFGTSDAKSFTVSFWVRSSVTGAFGIGFRNSAFNLSYWTTYTINSANTWEYKSVTIPGSTSGTWYTNNSYGINLIFSLGCGATNKVTSNNAWASGSKLGAVGQTDLIATTGATFYITGVQLEVGAKATPFEHRSYGDELARCKRYYQKSSPRYMAAQYLISDEICSQFVPFKPEMRATPSPTYGNLSYRENSGSFINSSLTSNATLDKEGINFALTASGAATSDSFVIYMTGGEFDAEL